MLTLFKKDETPTSDAGEEAGKSRRSLLVLLLIIVAFCYIYFFTGLIVPREQPSKTPPAPAAPLKKPMPPRPEGTAGKEQG